MQVYIMKLGEIFANFFLNCNLKNKEEIGCYIDAIASSHSQVTMSHLIVRVIIGGIIGLIV